jgi:hypothetical protein
VYAKKEDDMALKRGMVRSICITAQIGTGKERLTYHQKEQSALKRLYWLLGHPRSVGHICTTIETETGFSSTGFITGASVGTTVYELECESCQRFFWDAENHALPLCFECKSKRSP